MSGGLHFVCWEMPWKPWDLGRLVVGNLKHQNEALLA